MNKLIPRPFTKIFCLVFLFLAIHVGANESGEVQIEITLDPAGLTQEFEGLGAVSAGASSRLLIDYPEPYRSHILDFLFAPNYGAGFQHIKVEIGGEINSTDGSEPTHKRHRGEENYHRGYEWWLMKEAKKRNPDILLDCLAWGAPGWIGNGNYFTQEGADYIVSFIRGAKQAHGLSIDYAGILNEREFDPAWIKMLRKTLDDNGFPRVKIVAGDMNGPPADMWKIADMAMADSSLAACIHAIGVHYVWGEMPTSAKTLQKKGIRLWASETGEWDWNTMLPFLYRRAQTCNTNFIKYGLTKTAFWSLVTSYYDCLPAPRSGVIQANTPWSGAYDIQPTLWAIAHTTQFAKPGWYFLKAACQILPKGGSYVTYLSPDRTDFSMVIETTGATALQELVIKPSSTLSKPVLHVWQTDMIEEFAYHGSLTLKDGNWTLRLQPNSIYTLTTTTGQQKGYASSPVSQPFPLPYLEDFESYPAGATPRYLSDQGGAYEVVERNDGGKCLRQQTHREGIDWAESSFAASVIGDPMWNDIEVSVEVAFEALPETTEEKKMHCVSVIARYHPGSTWIKFTTPYPVGYSLRLYGDGTWQLTTARKVISEGRIAHPGNAWHTLTLRCRKNTIAAYIDDQVVLKIEDSTYQHGLVGIGSSFHPTRFDKLLIMDYHEKIHP